MRSGIGYDVHRLVEGRKLVLGGVEIPFEKGLLGHSDADVLTHAVCDALLGAAGLGDIGRHFPDTDGAYKDIFSLLLLEKTSAMIDMEGFVISNIDATIFAEKPKLAPYMDQMACNIASYAGIDSTLVNVKATTTEGLGMFGKGEGMGAMAIALIQKK
jgi:2-C-methyl-D-erythritol 2,4-cyclodiphosphate synthase